ncbi:MAG: H+/Na+-translocating ferredoxin:NAD+ oxidoreductase subunit [Methanothermococcus sp.]|uniref:4Fe-4S binding protein n=1 Tax=Methanothermococcus TaxID=155862 RepID=UPI0003711992|nr:MULTISPECIES: 4Fe-4S binding protein [Methanothermococcus]MDK2791085.1 H+/Na+-translocating ferredoxin:NAD+ oxidoreductase subunit [Methanothermococcus sp.]MDK2988126.1 H+/Na+-translocating ferredoxin:NAD+ oxidoreductase subunit [Methanothermococcus sp.]
MGSEEFIFKGNLIKNILKNLFGIRKKFDKGKKTEEPQLDSCIGCGLCVDVCPTDAIQVFKFRDIVCSSCGVCLEICPNDAILEDRYTIDKDKCTKCGYCAMFCTIPFIKNEIPLPKTPMITKECNNCRLCVGKCPENAIYASENKIHIDGKKCKNCLTCVDYCPMNAIVSSNDYVKSCIINVDINSCIFCKECEYVCPLKNR